MPPRVPTTSIYAVPSGSLGSSDKFGYTMKPEPIPKFEEDKAANCTFTVRVPRVYLTPEKREEITRRRHLWGSEVYTDDSDPIAVAIHQGWLRGEWPADVDETLLDIAGTATGVQPEMEIPAVMTEPLPTGPIVPPKDLDAHFTLLLLPPLEKYTASVRNGLRSRNWGANHDGVSFMLLKIEWLEDGVWGGSYMEERGAAARRKRLGVKARERKRALEWIAKEEEKLKKMAEKKKRERRLLLEIDDSGAAGEHAVDEAVTANGNGAAADAPPAAEITA